MRRIHDSVQSGRVYHLKEAVPAGLDGLENTFRARSQSTTEVLRVTPAMEAGLTDHVWSLEELCDLLPQRKPNARADREMILKALQKSA